MSPLHAVAELRAEAARIESESELECQVLAREAEINFVREQNNLIVTKAKALSRVEVSLRVEGGRREGREWGS